MIELLQKISCFLLALCVGEIIALLVFPFVIRNLQDTRQTNLSSQPANHDRSVAKGGLMLLAGFVLNIPTTIVFFGAIKIGTRLKDDTTAPISNDYFLIGNFI